jgi:hypothetical protein
MRCKSSLPPIAENFNFALAFNAFSDPFKGNTQNGYILFSTNYSLVTILLFEQSY